LGVQQMLHPMHALDVLKRLFIILLSILPAAEARILLHTRHVFGQL
jgi:hypothetical protein